MVECDCGERPVLNTFGTLYRCSIGREVLVQEERASRRRSDRTPQPWDDEYHEWREEHDGNIRAEDNDWLEWATIE